MVEIIRESKKDVLLVVEVGDCPDDVQHSLTNETLDEHEYRIKEEIDKDSNLVLLDTKNICQGVLITAYSKSMRKVISHYAFVVDKSKMVYFG